MCLLKTTSLADWECGLAVWEAFGARDRLSEQFARLARPHLRHRSGLGVGPLGLEGTDGSFRPWEPLPLKPTKERRSLFTRG